MLDDAVLERDERASSGARAPQAQERFRERKARAPESKSPAVEEPSAPPAADEKFDACVTPALAVRNVEVPLLAVVAWRSLPVARPVSPSGRWRCRAPRRHRHTLLTN